MCRDHTYGSALCISLLLIFLTTFALAQDEWECGQTGDYSQEFTEACTGPSDYYIDAIDTTEVILVFARTKNDATVPTPACTLLTDDGWIPSDTLPRFAHRVLCPTESDALDPDVHSAYPYRGNVTHFYYEMSGGKHVVWGKPFPRVIELAFWPAYYDTAFDGNDSDNDGLTYANLEVLDSLDVDASFVFADYDYDADGWVDVPIVICYPWLPSDMGTAVALLGLPEGCYATSEPSGDDSVRVYSCLGATIANDKLTGAIGIFAHEWGHLVLGNGWWRCDVDRWAHHTNTLAGYDVMAGRRGGGGSSRFLSGFWRYLAGWQPATVITSDAQGIELEPFRAWDDMGDLILLPLSYEIAGTEPCADDSLREYFLVENRQHASLWEDPLNLWGPDSLCWSFPWTNRLIGTGLAIYHVYEGYYHGGDDDAAKVPPKNRFGANDPNIYNLIDLELPEGLFDVEEVPEGWRPLYDQKPLTFGPGGWDRMNINPDEQGGMGVWNASDLWDGEAANCFAPYTNPSSGEYSPKMNGAYIPPYGAQDLFSGVGIINIAQVGETDHMTADFVVSYPAWDSVHVNTTWSGVIRLDSDLHIAEAETLTIAPGTRVVMTPWSDEFAGGAGPDSARIAINVSGTLLCSGSA